MDPVTLGMAKADAKKKYAPRRTVAGTNQFNRSAGGSPYAIGVDPVTGRAYYMTSPVGLAWSDDAGATKVTGKSAPVGVTDPLTIPQLVRFGDFLWLTAKDSADSRYKIYRSPIPTSGDFVWTAVHTMTAGAGGLGTCMDSDGQRLYVGEYGDPTGLRPIVWSIDLADANAAGTNWAVRWQAAANTRHIHTVACDPYRPGHVWVTGGDGTGFEVVRSEDYGATWITVHTTAEYQVVQVSFDENWIYGACDTAWTTFLVWDRETYTPRAGAKNWHAHLNVPGGAGSKVLTGAATATTNTLNAAAGTYPFTTLDRGKRVSDTQFRIQSESFITAVTNQDGTTGNYGSATLSKNVNNAGATVATVQGDRFYKNAFFGLVDPATGIYYCVANDSSAWGNRFGLFYCDRIGGDLRLLTDEINGGQRLFIVEYGGVRWLLSHQWRVQLPSLVDA